MGNSNNLKKTYIVFFSLFIFLLIFLFDRYEQKEQKIIEINNNINIIKSDIIEYEKFLKKENILIEEYQNNLNSIISQNYIKLNDDLIKENLYDSFLDISKNMDKYIKHISFYNNKNIEYKLRYSKKASTQIYEFFIKKSQYEYVLVSTIYVFNDCKNDIYMKKNEYFDINSLKYLIKHLQKQNFK